MHVPMQVKNITFVSIFFIYIHYDQGQSNFDGGYFFLSTHCKYCLMIEKIILYKNPLLNKQRICMSIKT